MKMKKVKMNPGQLREEVRRIKWKTASQERMSITTVKGTKMKGKQDKKERKERMEKKNKDKKTRGNKL